MIVGKYLQRQALERPDKVAIICNEVQMTFSDINLKTNRLANWLLAQGLKKGGRAVMLLPNCAEFAVVYFALMKIGIVAVILDVRLSPAEMAPIFDETEAKVIITHAKQKTFALRMLRERRTFNMSFCWGMKEAQKRRKRVSTAMSGS